MASPHASPPTSSDDSNISSGNDYTQKRSPNWSVAGNMTVFETKFDCFESILLDWDFRNFYNSISSGFHAKKNQFHFLLSGNLNASNQGRLRVIIVQMNFTISFLFSRNASSLRFCERSQLRRSEKQRDQASVLAGCGKCTEA